MRYLRRRLAQSVLLLVGVSVLSFVFMSLAPGDFLDEMRLDPQISPETVATLRVQFGLDRPWPVRYARWLKSVVRGNLGFSFAYNCPASSLIWVRARNTLLLASIATLLAWMAAIPLGVGLAACKRSWFDQASVGGTSLLLAIPDLVLALAFLLFAVRTGLAPTGGMVSAGFSSLTAWGKVNDLTRHLLLPVLVLVLTTLPVLVRHVRASVIEVLESPFLRAARAHGIPPRTLLFRYSLKAAANPLTSLVGFSIATLLSGSLLVEVVLSWPGLGPLLLEAVLGRDLYLVVDCVMLSTVFLVMGNLVADLLLYAVDPRIRV